MRTGAIARILPIAGLMALAACRPERPPQRVCGDVADDLGLPVSGAIVRVGPGGGFVTTDAAGRFCAAAPPVASVTAEATGFCALAAPVPSDPGGWARVRLRRALVVQSWYQVGFDAPVELRADLRCPMPGPVSFRWEQIGGPPLGAAATGWTGARLSFRTPPLAASTGRPDVLALSPAQAGRYRFRVTARAGDRIAEAPAEATAASPSSGLLSVPTDADVYLDPGPGNAGGSWTLASRPEGSLAQLRAVPTVDGRRGVARMRPDAIGAYEVVEKRTGTRLVLQAGPWDLVPRDCHRPECHPGEQAGWELSRHARALDSRLGMPGPEPFEGWCLECHAVGYDPGARNGGFDDVAAGFGLELRGGFPGGGEALPRDARRLANVWCVSCHGPGRLPEHGKRPMVVRAGVCARCHDLPPRYRVVEEWRTSAMSVPPADAALLEPACAGCHTAQGAISRSRGRVVTVVDPALAEPVTCAVCHVAHTDAPAMLRRSGTAATASGVLLEAGRGAVCVDCHQAGQKPDIAAEADRRAPAAPQSEMLAGKGAFGASGVPAPLTPNLCIECHMSPPGAPESGPDRRFGGHTFRAPVTTERAPEDCDGDGRIETLDREVDACIAKLSEAIDRAFHAVPGCEDAAIVVMGDRLRPAGGAGEVVAACESEWLLGERTPLYRAAYDRAFVERDGSKGAHNPAFAIRVLRAALELGLR